MTRRRLEEKFLDYLDGGLPPAESAEFDAHLVADAELRASLEAYKKVIEIEKAAGAEEAKLGASFSVKVMARIEEDGAGSPANWLRGLTGRHRYALTAIATLATVLVVLKLGVDIPDELISTKSAVSWHKSRSAPQAAVVSEAPEAGVGLDSANSKPAGLPKADKRQPQVQAGRGAEGALPDRREERESEVVLGRKKQASDLQDLQKLKQKAQIKGAQPPPAKNAEAAPAGDALLEGRRRAPLDYGSGAAAPAPAAEPKKSAQAEEPRPEREGQSGNVPAAGGAVARLGSDRAIRAGEKIPETTAKDSILLREEAPAGLAADVEELSDEFAQENIEPNSPIQRAQPAEQKSAGSLPISQGMRAVTIEVDAESGIEGWVQPGARVDVVLTQPAQGGLQSKVIVQNARVLSAAGNAEVESNRIGGKVGAITRGSTTTLEVAPSDSLVVITAKKMGTLSLITRDSGDDKATGTTDMTAASMMGGKKEAGKDKERCNRGSMRIGGKEYVVDCEGSIVPAQEEPREEQKSPATTVIEAEIRSEIAPKIKPGVRVDVMEIFEVGGRPAERLAAAGARVKSASVLRDNSAQSSATLLYSLVLEASLSDQEKLKEAVQRNVRLSVRLGD